MAEFTKLLDRKRINILGIGDMKKEELIEVSQLIGLEKVNIKSLEMLRREIGHLSKLFLAGQVCLLIGHGQRIFNLLLRVRVTIISIKEARLEVFVMFIVNMPVKWDRNY